MNKQEGRNRIEWTEAYGRPGFTWNPVAGCLHECRWKMPSLKIAVCYAEDTAEHGAAITHYPQGFAHHYWHPQRLPEPLKLSTPGGIFIGSMADLFGRWVEDWQIQRVLDVCAEASQHIFFTLTKNTPRLLKFEYPPNVWVGASSPPDFMWGKELGAHQKYAMLERTLEVLAQLDAVTWLSAEPLSWDISSFVRNEPDALCWMVIGAASDGKRHYPPREADLKSLLKVMDDLGQPVFFKGNLRSLPYADENWREGFPSGVYTPPVKVAVVPVTKPVQLSLF